MLRAIGALSDTRDASGPIVCEASRRAASWDEYAPADVVVGIPASISPAQSDESPPPTDLLDLVVVDEAHHAPAATWMAILDYFDARAMLLTSTPHRRGKKRMPGKLVYYFALR